MTIKGQDPAVALKNSRAVIGFNFCEQLYKIEKELREQYATGYFKS